MRPPAFWAGPRDTLSARLLSSLEGLTAMATARRVARTGFRASVPVICCGNVTVGGAGKTVVALDLTQRLAAMGRRVHVLLRGYGGTLRGPHRVSADDDSARVGDEALLLAVVAPTWIGADRAASARAAIAAGADILLLDDGLQNPTLSKDLSLLVIDGGSGFGNRRLLPAGPLREPIAVAASRCHAAVLIGPDRTNAAAALPPALLVLRANLVPGPEVAALADRAVLAFAGIGRPEKFFATLAEAGARLVATEPFADHHPYRAAEIDRLLDRAARLGAVAVTTAKDAVRVPPPLRGHVEVARVSLAWDDAVGLGAILSRFSISSPQGASHGRQADDDGREH
ncbi:MAG: tetraacyldisaccharide 4'-kinase [Acetobacteraceae bacterium]